MVIYQCDMCHKQFKSKEELRRLIIEPERFINEPHKLCYTSMGLRVESELCEQCVTTIANTVADMIANGGVTIE